MNLDMHVIKNKRVTLMQWLFGTGLVAVVGAVLWIFIYVAINEPKITAKFERQKAEELEQENRVFCAKFGMTFGTPAFAACANELAQIRRLSEERLNRDAGIL